MKLMVLFFAGLPLVPVASNAGDVTVKVYKESKAKGGADWELLKLIIAAEGNAYTWMEAAVEHEHMAPLFCVPSNLSLNAQNFVDVIDSSIRNYKLADTDVIDPYLLQGLRFTFPCK